MDITPPISKDAVANYPPGTFPLLKLPRELRDRVYQAALIKYAIDISITSCASDDDNEDYRAKSPQPKFRATFISSGKKMTYRLDKDAGCSCGACYPKIDPDVQLFYVNRQVFEESRRVFYAHNLFHIPLYSGLGCSAFFQDREASIKFIRSLSFDVFLHPTDFAYGRYATKCLKLLVRAINKETALRHLALQIHGVVPDVTDEEKWKCPCDCAVFEHPLIVLGNAAGVPGTPQLQTKKVHEGEWTVFKTLRTITGLTRLTINVDFCSHMLDHPDHDTQIFRHDHCRKFIAYMRSGMLKNGDKLGDKQIQSFCRSGDHIEDPRYRFHADDTETGDSLLTPVKDLPPLYKHHMHDESDDEHDSQNDEEDSSEGNEWEDEDEGILSEEGLGGISSTEELSDDEDATYSEYGLYDSESGEDAMLAQLAEHLTPADLIAAMVDVMGMPPPPSATVAAHAQPSTHDTEPPHEDVD